MFEADNQWLLEERHENGTYKNAVYILGNGMIVLEYPEELVPGMKNDAAVYTNIANNGGFGVWTFEDVTISSDGRTITTGEGFEFKAYLQGDPDMPNIPNWQLPWN